MKSTIKKFLAYAYKYTPIIFLVTIPLLALYGNLSDGDFFEKELKKHKYDYKILIGLSNKTLHTQNNTYFNKSRTYLILDKGLKNIQRININNNSRTGISVKIENGGLIQYIALYLFFAFWTWFAWLRKPTQREVNA